MTPRTRTLAVVGLAGAIVLGTIAFLRDARRDAASEDGAAETPAPSAGRRGGRTSGDAPETEAAPADPRIAHVPTDLIAATFRNPLVFTGVVEESSGTPPEQVGATCRLGLDRSDDPSLCRVIVQCGGTRLHGDPIAHDTRCGLDGAGALVLLDDASTHQADGDASLSLAGDLLTIRDDRRSEYGDYALVVRLHSTTPGALGAL